MLHIASNTKPGSCCVCREREAIYMSKVRFLLAIHRKAPVSGTGWGCIICGINGDGAIYVSCEICVSKRPVEICVGPILNHERMPYEDLEPGHLNHDSEKHRKADEAARINAYQRIFQAPEWTPRGSISLN